MWQSFFLITSIMLGIILIFLIVNLLSPSYLQRVSQKQRVKRQMNPTPLSRRVYVTIAFVLLLGYQVYRYPYNAHMWYYPVILYSFIWQSALLIASIEYKVYQIDPNIDEETQLMRLRNFNSIVVVPVYHEDPVTFQQMLASLAEQELPPTAVYIVEDGSEEGKTMAEIVAQWQGNVPFILDYRYVVNGGKRVAQSYVFQELMDTADVFITMDSDTVLDPRGVYECLVPFLDEEVMSVAGLLLAKNTKNWLAKIVSLSFAASFTNGRASSSYFDAVSVSCGGLAAYRNVVLQRFLPHYLNQVVFGAKAKFGDDRMLTHYAALLGRTVYQETAVGYTLMPENLSHLTRQRIRWWKSFWWGGMFLIRHHSPRYMIWWLLTAQYVAQILYSVVFPFVLIIHPWQKGAFPWYILGYMVVLGYIRCIRLFDMKQANGERYVNLGKYLLLTPFSTLLNIYLGTFLAYYGFVMMWQVTEWGTRAKIEVASEVE